MCGRVQIFWGVERSMVKAAKVRSRVLGVFKVLIRVFSWFGVLAARVLWC